MPKTPAWEQFEHDVQEMLGLDATICSGNKFNDIGDATDNRPPGDDSFRLLIDCKYTEQVSFSVGAKFMGQWVDRATEWGKRFVLAIRFLPRGASSPREYVVLTLDDFAELLEAARRADQSSKWPVDRTYLERDEHKAWH